MSLLVILLAALTAFAGVAPLAEARPKPRRPPAEKPDPEQEAVAQARRHFQKGEKLYALGRFEEALVEYEAAFDASPMPELLFNIGQCHRNLENYDAAIFTFKKFLRLKPDAPNAEAVEKLIDELKEARDRQQAATRKLVVTPDRPPVTPHPPTLPPPDRPLYTRWWFIGGLVLVGVAAGGGIYMWQAGGGPPDSDLGNLDFPR